MAGRSHLRPATRVWKRTRCPGTRRGRCSRCRSGSPRCSTCRLRRRSECRCCYSADVGSDDSCAGLAGLETEDSVLLMLSQARKCADRPSWFNGTQQQNASLRAIVHQHGHHIYAVCVAGALAGMRLISAGR